jgi:hypothetical protein
MYNADAELRGQIQNKINNKSEFREFILTSQC